MQDQNKVYGISLSSWIHCIPYYFLFTQTGFTVSLYEYEATIPTLWETTKGVYKVVTYSRLTW